MSIPGAELEEARELPVAEPACSNCGARPLVGAFCHSCGQEESGQLTVGTVVQGFAQQFATLDFTILQTLAQATLHPGRLARQYAAGKRQPYTSPIAYAFLMGTVLAVSIGLGGFESWLAAASDSSAVDSASFLSAVGPALPYVRILGLLPTAVVLRWLLRRETRHNVAECYVLLLFTWGQVFLITAVVVATGVFDTALGQGIAGLAAVGLLAWGLREFDSLPASSALGASVVVFLCSEVIGSIIGWGWIIAASYLGYGPS